MTILGKNLQTNITTTAIKRLKISKNPMRLGISFCLPLCVYCATKIFTVLLDANAAEHAARTVAMQIASDNATDLLADLTLSYNKDRQQEITAEILDLVGGTMA